MNGQFYGSYREEFEAKHGNDGINMGDGIILFSDGARAERHSNGYCLEPPTDPHELAHLKLFYLDEMVDRAITEFETMRLNLSNAAQVNINSSGQGYVLPPPDVGALKKLKELKQNVKRLLSERNKAAKMVDATEPAELKHKRALVQEGVAMNEEFLHELNKIRL